MRMKLKYTKPRLIVETYHLAQHIAACGWDMTSENKETCSAGFDPGIEGNHPGFPTLFTNGRSDCMFQADKNKGIIGGMEYCYSNGTMESIRVFQS